MVDTPLDKLLEIGYKNMRQNQQAFRDTAAKIDPKRTPLQILEELDKDHPPARPSAANVSRCAGRPAPVYRAAQDRHDPIDGAADCGRNAAVLRALSTASMDTPGPFENVAKEAFFNVTLPEPNWTKEHIEEHLAVVQSRHHHQHRRSRGLSGPLHAVSVDADSAIQGTQADWTPAPTADGWAHYAEQMMLDRRLRNGDLKLRLGQLQDALLRNARYIVGIEMHTGKDDVRAGSRFLREGGLSDARPRRSRDQARHFRPDVSVLHAGQTARF